MRMPEPQLQRACACGGGCPECQAEQFGYGHERLQTQRVESGDWGQSGVLSTIHGVLSSPGQPLVPASRRFMESRFGHDFSRVRVHTGENAAASAKAVGALAYTVGHNVVFAGGQYAPATLAGKRLIAHELTHVIQQQTEPRPANLALSWVDGSLEEDAPQIGQSRLQPESLARSIYPSILQRQASPPPAPDIEDCEPWQTAMLITHLAPARTWVDDAARKVDDYAYVFATPRHSAAPRSPATAAVVRSALQDNFHTTSPGAVLAIKEGFDSLRSALNRSFTYECEDEGCDDQAYVRGAFSWIRRRGDIHVCPPWFQCRDYFRRVTTLIHERAHQYPGATDNAYEWESSYSSLTSDDAIDNAESYAVAARQIYHGGAHGPGMPAC
jgi:hypothetical protein